MTTTLVSARMSPSKKEAGSRALKKLGSNASQAINELYDYVIEHGVLPWQAIDGAASCVTKEQLNDALDWVDGLQISLSPEFSGLTLKDVHKQRLGLR